MSYNKSGRYDPWVFVSWTTSKPGEEQSVQLTKTHGSKRPDLLYYIYVAWFAQKTFSFTYDTTMSPYNSINSRKGYLARCREPWQWIQRRGSQAGSWLCPSQIIQIKGVFRAALCLRYEWHPHLLPSHCVCSQRLTIEHALSCSRGGFPSIRHNEIRDLTADLRTEVCYGVGIKPGLQPVTKE